MNVNTVNSVAFNAKQKKAKEYQRTDMFKIAGGVLGATATTASYIVTKKLNPEILAGATKLKMAGGVAAIAAAGVLVGSFMDMVLNKIVKNVTVSIKGPSQD